ncbi:restriction endonuclease subunit S [Pectobacterium parmentieri]|uniref:Restriction endonuclease subunit S n=1 Tax=Pectobacterium parmentieri TaxID=1905730 RepID=A0ABS0RYG8_PECPM|nr:restriction endonuclease subunit S [Pectobacterium parmentieri]MBI0471285.1 restriction endonuclease subunit S [Pectobacterium parmentieri]MBI0493897.1 restriction endonuclease subunit S [Pectobacterium parmentieri]MBI0554681.1 restriction endonuclease subunit S [Pectobacterium parmentieri]MBI0568163.1 restriction endonuclease subunit S [Pectobacterium parmentieri]MBI0573132.1 restriction endonuclease subunit S [Pectobacterium parmentieri]
MSFEEQRLEELCELVIDCPHSTPKWTDKGFIVLRNQNIRKGILDLSTPSFTDEDGYKSRIKRAKPKADDIVFTREAPMGEVCLIPEGIECCLGQRQVLLRANNTVDPYYLFWALQSAYVQHQISWNEGTGTTVSNVRIPVLKDLKIPRLGVAESWIAKTMTSLASKSQINERINQTLEQMAQALFKCWFVDFEPVKAKMAVLEVGGSQEEATLAAMTAISGKDADALVVFERENPKQYAELKVTAELFPSAMRESALGDVPEGWITGKLGDIIEFNPKRVLKKGNIASYLDMKNVPVTGHSAQDVIEREFSSGSKFRNGDTLLARITPCLENGKTAYVDFLPTDEIVGWGSTEFIVMRSKKRLPLSLSYFFARLDSFRTIAIQSMQGTSGRQRADASVLEQHVWILPPNGVLQKFGTFSDFILDGNRSRNTENKSLAQLRDTLLPKLLSGEITLPEAEQAVSEVEHV